ncbi:hypothetical protein Shyd_02940 [Streptomyces hydrogenans]|uniref:Uncharacterized protein n=1 Tax=Streptomyces hydrogenans TaxID=1873719 RepID=A0ABQ3P1M4_9ACTN|nr:hypothetical protein GCM10018784_09630 [Streptomyces hydrogenans]GHI18923.1 hypothetical protein Shyd_02940 [Streptomyces hydrogenans]
MIDSHSPVKTHGYTRADASVYVRPLEKTNPGNLPNAEDHYSAPSGTDYASGSGAAVTPSSASLALPPDRVPDAALAGSAPGAPHRLRPAAANSVRRDGAP